MVKTYASNNTMVKLLTTYICNSCGTHYSRYMGKCGSCGEFNSIEEVVTENKAINKVNTSNFANNIYQKPIPITDIPSYNADRYSTKLLELDRVLGGGLVPGMVILLGGEPGIGKSTLVLQIADALNGKVLYASGEESEHQIKLRAKRLEINNSNINLFSETNVNRIIEAADIIKPNLLLIDSIQTLFNVDFESSSGSVSQVRGCATLLARWAKSTNTPIILVGHITKDGTMAGPKILEHLVDTVLVFEGDRHHHNRILRALKNRFGAAFELGIFNMTEKGLEAVSCSSFFLETTPGPGCATTVILSGTRPIVVEIQALVATTNNIGMTRRTALGIDGQRLAMLCAVIERRGGIKINNKDVYLNVAGGLDIEDPSADLAIVAALTSSALNKTILEKTLFLGEVGLTGEIRPISQLPLKLQEGARLGFTNAVIPKLNNEIIIKQASQKLILEQNIEKIGFKSWFAKHI